MISCKFKHASYFNSDVSFMISADHLSDNKNSPDPEVSVKERFDNERVSYQPIESTIPRMFCLGGNYERL